MNTRERFVETMRFGQADRPPLIELGFWPETLNRWYKEGLPPDVDVNTFFGFDEQFPDWGIKIDFYPIPRFIERTIEETERYRIYTNQTGVTLKQFKDGIIRGMPQYLDFALEDRKSWQQFKQRLNPHDPCRYPKNWGKELVDYLNGGDYPVPLGINTATASTASFFGLLRNLMGLEKLLYLFYDDPNLVHEINQYYEHFSIEVLKKAIRSVKFDFMNIYEDMGYKGGSLISPSMFREFMFPHYKKLISFLIENGIDIIMVDSDGNVEELIPLWIEAGVNFVHPLEVAAGMDAIKLRKKYGKNLRLMGNIDKRALIKGKTAIKEEVMSKVPSLIRQGGYIPCIDHAVSPDISFENYLYYLSLIKKIFGME